MITLFTESLKKMASNIQMFGWKGAQPTVKHATCWVDSTTSAHLVQEDYFLVLLN